MEGTVDSGKFQFQKQTGIKENHTVKDWSIVVGELTWPLSR